MSHLFFHLHMLPKFHQCVSCIAAGGDVCLRSYLSRQLKDESQQNMLACFLVYHSVPLPGQLAAGGLEGKAGVHAEFGWMRAFEFDLVCWTKCILLHYVAVLL